ncbi:MAG TPA: ABC transporter ATP-binding protein [Baekduia sp.]|uniref:ABC transporter ATP-binding protein n=1 Tax=Baekduia sp. TaxID=2600305 RepID=UPI002D768504|nr:ABC transporter ATP-binding protein [Baekduia sp.]HET6506343.1 ABC transporter ATP-binding protein [Baekduia sp.]
MLAVHDAVVKLGGVEILHGAHLAAAPGRLVAVVGPNGAGKSTLVRAAAGIQKLESGTVRWDGVDVAALRGRKLAKLRAFVPQRARVPDGVRVHEAVAIGRAPHLGPLSRPTRADHDAVERAMGRAGVLAFADRRLNTLSGGELQRVQVAVALAQEAPALLADEPTSALDLGATSTMARLLRGLADDGLTVVLVVHDLALAAAVADEVVVVSHGRTVAAGPPDTVLTESLLAEVWQVDASLAGGALHVDWLGRTPGRTPTKEPLA